MDSYRGLEAKLSVIHQRHFTRRTNSVQSRVRPSGGPRNSTPGPVRGRGLSPGLSRRSPPWPCLRRNSPRSPPAWACVGYRVGAPLTVRPADLKVNGSGAMSDRTRGWGNLQKGWGYLQSGFKRLGKPRMEVNLRAFQRENGPPHCISREFPPIRLGGIGGNLFGPCHSRGQSDVRWPSMSDPKTIFRAQPNDCRSAAPLGAMCGLDGNLVPSQPKLACGNPSIFGKRQPYAQRVILVRFLRWPLCSPELALSISAENSAT